MSRHHLRLLLIVFALGALAFGWPVTASGQSGQFVKDNYYAAGEAVDVPSPVTGDVVAAGRAVFCSNTGALPEVVSDEPYALLLSRVGNQVQVRLGDTVIYRGGRLGDDEFDAAKRPVLIPIPTNGAPATSLTVGLTVLTSIGLYALLSQGHVDRDLTRHASETS